MRFSLSMLTTSLAFMAAGHVIGDRDLMLTGGTLGLLAVGTWVVCGLTREFGAADRAAAESGLAEIVVQLKLANDRLEVIDDRLEGIQEDVGKVRRNEW